ncbi:MAG TPA: hypothetical protein VF282_09860 [Bacillota bacterium]
MPRRRPASFAEVAQRVEGFLLRALILVLLLLVIGQGLLSFESLRPLLSYVDRLEGRSYDPAELYGDAVGATFLSGEASPVLTVSVMVVSAPSAPDVHLLVNGFPVARFEEPRVTIEVNEGDRLELDGRGTAEVFRFRVVDAAPQLATPEQGREIILYGDRKLIGSARLRTAP